jgi:dihydrofolate synthase/folylpolyglutamate synthase
MADDALDYLLRQPQFANVADDARKPGLDRMHTLMDAMGDPHKDLHAIHVAGTNGKGSVASMIAAIATAAGLRTGLHTSPHLTHVTQRMCIDGTPAPTDWLAAAVDEHRPLFDRVEPSFFEMTVALTFKYFAEQDVDLAVVEVGLGGRLDSTNVLHPALAVITNIDLDHTDLLGDTLGAIAREKAGIIKEQTPVLSGVVQDEARAAIAEVADDQGVPLHEVRDEVDWRAPHADLSGNTLDAETPLRRYDRLRVSLAGAHQQANAALALRAAELVVPAVQASPVPVHKGLRDVRRYTGFRGRLEMLQKKPLIVLDVAHNPSGIAAGLQTVGPAVDKQGGSLYVCLNAVRGKGLPDIADRLAEHGAHVIPIPIDTQRAIPPDEIADTLRARGVAVRKPRSLRQALIDYQHFARAGDGLLLTGSHKMVEVLPDDVSFRRP